MEYRDIRDVINLPILEFMIKLLFKEHNTTWADNPNNCPFSIEFYFQFTHHIYIIYNVLHT